MVALIYVTATKIHKYAGKKTYGDFNPKQSAK